MARRLYSDDDKARGLAALTLHDGNITRASAECGLPQSTLRDWRKEWTRPGGGPPAPVEQKAAEQLGEFADRATEVRDDALAYLHASLRDAKPRDLATIVGILDDKIARAKGLASQRIEVSHSGPSPEEMRQMLSGFVAESVAAARARDDVIIDADVVEQAPRALNP